MKRTLIKIFTLILAVAMITSVFTACGGGGGDNGGGNTPAPTAPTTPSAPSGGDSGGSDAYDGPVMTVRVVTMCPVSGTSARTGITQKAAVDAAVQHMAEDDFINPAYKIEFDMDFVDDESSTDKAAIAANLAISKDPHIVIGHHLTTMIMISAPFFEEAKIPLIGIISGPAPATMGWEWFHYGTCTDADAGITLADYLANVKGFKNILIMARNDEGGKVGAAAVRAALESHGVSIPDSNYMEFATDDNEFSAHAMRAKELQVECVLTYGLGATAALTCYDQLEQIYGSIPDTVFFAGSTSFAQPSMAEMFPPEKIEGIVFPSAYIHDPDNPFVVRFENQFKENDPEGMWPGDNNGRVYDACWNIAAAVNLLAENDGYLHPDNDPNFRERLNYWLSQLVRQGVQGEINYAAFTDGRIIKNANIGEWRAVPGDVSRSFKIYPK